MSTLRLRRFGSPGALKTIDLPSLVLLLRREGGDYLRTLVDLTPDPTRFDYDRLAAVLADPQEGFPVRLADAPVQQASRGALTKHSRSERADRARRHWPWSELLWHVFGVAGFRCPRCGGSMVVRAVIIHPPATLRTLGGLDRAAARAPPAGDAQAA